MAPGHKARAAKAAAAADKDARERAKKEADESAAWDDGADVKSRKRKEEADRAAAEKAARKAAADAQLKAEAEEAAKVKLRGGDKVAARQSAKVAQDSAAIDRAAAPTLSGTGIDAALAVLTLATGKGADGGGDDADGSADMHAAVEADVSRARASLAATASGMTHAEDAHPEKRAKAAWMRFRERRLPEVKAEYPSLRMTQHLEMLQREWKKSPENPLVAAERLKQLGGAS